MKISDKAETLATLYMLKSKALREITYLQKTVIDLDRAILCTTDCDAYMASR